MNTFDICSKFGIGITKVQEIKTGIINNTFVVTDTTGKKYILQEINSNIFKDIDGLMNNIENVTDFLRNKIESEGGDPSRETLTINKCQSNDKNFLEVIDANKNKHYFRLYDYIDNACTYDEASEKYLREAGKGFGKFQKQLNDFDSSLLVESIPDFHNTRKRLETFLHSLDEAYKTKDADYISKAYPSIKYALLNANNSNIIMDALQTGKIPTRVVHNDTKLNNVMLDTSTDEALCVIDLDTIMPGSMLFDYGDAIRYCANAGLEDDVNLDNVHLDINKFKAFTEGFLSEIAPIITKEELGLMATAPIVLTYELGLRFLTDYLDGNKYFKCDNSRPEHNLERTKAQFKLVQDLRKEYYFMNAFIHATYKKFSQNLEKE